MSDLEFGLELISKMFGIFKVFGVLGIGLTAFGIYMIVSRSKSKHNNEPTVDGSLRKNYKKFPIVGIVAAMWFGISWMISGLAGAILGSTMNSPYFKERLQEEVAKGNATVTVNGEQVTVTTPTPVPTKEPTVTLPTKEPVVSPLALGTPIRVTVPKQTGETFEATYLFDSGSTETLTLMLPKEWEKDTIWEKTKYSVLVSGLGMPNVFDMGVNDEASWINVKYGHTLYDKGTTDWISKEMDRLKEVFDFEDFVLASELDIEGASDKSYIFGWNDDDEYYKCKNIEMLIAGSPDTFVKVEIEDVNNVLSWDEWKTAIDKYIAVIPPYTSELPAVTPAPEEPVSEDELFTATIEMGLDDTLTLHFPKEWEEDAYVCEYFVAINCFSDIEVEYGGTDFEKGTTDWINKETQFWKEIYKFEELSLANELNLEGATDKSYIFGWDTSYGARYIKMYIAGSLDNFLEIEIIDYGTGMTWEEWKDAINLFIVRF